MQSPLGNEGGPICVFDSSPKFSCGCINASCVPGGGDFFLQSNYSPPCVSLECKFEGSGRVSILIAGSVFIANNANNANNFSRSKHVMFVCISCTLDRIQLCPRRIDDYRDPSHHAFCPTRSRDCHPREREIEETLQKCRVASICVYLKSSTSVIFFNMHRQNCPGGCPSKAITGPRAIGAFQYLSPLCFLGHILRFRWCHWECL